MKNRSRAFRRWPLLLCLLPALQCIAHPATEINIDRLDQLIAQHPRQQDLYIKRGEALAHDRQWQRARADLEYAQSLGDPRRAAFALGRLHYQRQDYDAARTAFSQFLALHPGNAKALLYRARAAQVAGDAPAALTDFEAYLRSSTRSHPGDWIAAARLHEEQETPDLAAAISLLDEGMQRLGLQPQIQRYAIQLEVKQNNLPEAIKRCRELEVVLGQSPRWQVEIAELLLQSGQRQEALARLDQARQQLDQLRNNPARQALKERIEQLRIS